MKNYHSLLFGIRYSYFSTCTTISMDFTAAGSPFSLGLHTCLYFDLHFSMYNSLRECGDFSIDGI